MSTTKERTSCTSFVRCNDMWLAKDNRFLNPMSTYERNLMAPTCLIINFYLLIIWHGIHASLVYNFHLHNSSFSMSFWYTKLEFSLSFSFTCLSLSNTGLHFFHLLLGLLVLILLFWSCSFSFPNLFLITSLIINNFSSLPCSSYISCLRI